MAFVYCRECGHEIKAETKQTRCEKCGTFFPFTCAVCDKYLRPPFDVYEDERFVTEDGKPLCQEHYQRQCPECKKWFQADENPGYFLCLDCSKAREERVSTASKAPATRTKSSARPERERPAKGEIARRAPAPNFDTLVLGVIGGSAVIGVLFLLLKLLRGG
jgi:Zn finger protein HypA/HybF involved in hydrogenase expression